VNVISYSVEKAHLTERIKSRPGGKSWIIPLSPDVPLDMMENTRIRASTIG
jgi:hypothetical protein